MIVSESVGSKSAGTNTHDASVFGRFPGPPKKAICPADAERMSATDKISVSGSPRRRPPTNSAISRTFIPTIYIVFVEKSGLSRASLYGIHGGLEEYFDTFDMTVTVILEATENLC